MVVSFPDTQLRPAPGTDARRILIVGDEPQITQALDNGPDVGRYEVIIAPDGATALLLAASAQPDAVLLDIGLPDLPGIDVIYGLRVCTSMGIIVVSGQSSSADKVAALDAGADDYVTKPFSAAELLARLRAVLRRPPGSGIPSTVDVGEYRIDLDAYTAVPRSGKGRAPHFTPTEWQLLVPLLRNPGRLVTGHQLLREVWGPGSEKRTNYLRIHMVALRRKLEPDPSHPRYLITEPGLGYRFDR
ncbi:response regulator transcription factor [Streptomyces sp. RB6PN25]|uniref:Response regulator transcription factor n=1 Tax=Streptomyces humicola TaxID=2953240 RepID=A0ABT1PWW6_9ACTN|nr:response regulator transcription factor [Streptomyces humicola]MCQ4082171.1 response regulator transcription factor [Streptomyces humicola]